VGPKILHHSNISDPANKRALSTGRNLVQISEFAVGNTFTHAPDCGVKSFNVTNTSDDTRTIKGRNQPIGLVQIGRNRLLDHCVDTGLGKS